MFNDLSAGVITGGIVAASVAAILIVLFLFKGYRLLGIAMIPNDGIGIVTKKFGMLNSRLPDGRILARNKEAGLQADTLAPGLYLGFWPWQFSIDVRNFVTVPQGQVGIVEAKDGDPIPTGHVLGKHVDCNSFQDVRKFLDGGGQRGPQLDIVPPGTYRINTAMFTVKMMPALSVPPGRVVIITTQEGAPLPSGEIAGHIIEGHNSFQDAAAFIDRGGSKGLQEQVLLAGLYYVNPMFVSCEITDMVDVPIGYVGVVVSFVGAPGQDTTGAAFTHGNIVEKGQKGVWKEPLDPGRYAINSRTMRMEPVPTTNIVLNWATGKSEAHQLDKSLSTITVRSGDGFKFNLDVSQIIHVSRENAPLVIARFGTMSNLVTQVLEPTIGNYFRNSAQSSTVIDFLTTRSERQAAASTFIKEAVDKYNVVAVDTLIGDISPPEELMKTLTDRKVAEQEQLTIVTQRTREVSRQDFEQAKNEADTRGQVVQASRRAEVAKLDAEATVNKAKGDAEAKTVNAQADAAVTRVNGEAMAGRTQSVGDAEASVLGKKVAALGQQFYALTQVIGDLAAAKTVLVPQVQVQGGGVGGERQTIIDAFLGSMLAGTANGHARPIEPIPPATTGASGG